MKNQGASPETDRVFVQQHADVLGVKVSAINLTKRSIWPTDGFRQEVLATSASRACMA